MDTTTQQVEIYSTPTCHFCHMAKDWFTANNVSFVDHDVAADMERRKEVVEMTGQMGVPVIKIGNDIIIGFNQPKLEELLNIKSA
jgi:glutaredoxin-like YruB-family protein